MNDKKEIFENAPVPQAFAKMVIPCVITTLVMIIYNMADTFFVGQTGDVNKVAAVSLTTPIFMMLMAVANILGIGGSTAIGNALGSGNKKRVRDLSAFSTYSSLIIGIIIALMIVIMINPLLNLLGTSSHTYEFAKSYTIVLGIGAPFILFSNAIGHVVRAEGAANESMIGSMISTVINIVLDPILIQGFNMGTTGAAIATVIGNICGSIYFVWYITKKSNNLSLNFYDFKWNESVGTSVLSIGLPSGISSVFMSIATILLNICLVAYGDASVAAWGVASKANMLLVLIQMGVGNGVQTLLAYNYGAGNHKRFREILKFGMVFSVTMGTVLTALYLIGSESVIKIFIDDRSVINDGSIMLRAVSLSGPVIGMLYIGISSMQAMGKALPAIIISICRQGIVFIPFLFILRAVWGYNGIIFSQAIADYITIIVSVVLLILIMRKCVRKE